MSQNVVHCRGLPSNLRKVILGNLTFMVRVTALGTIVGSAEVVVIEDVVVGSVVVDVIGSVEVVDAVTVEAVVLGGVVVGVAVGSATVTVVGGSRACGPIGLFKHPQSHIELIAPSLSRYPPARFPRQCQCHPL